MPSEATDGNEQVTSEERVHLHEQPNRNEKLHENERCCELRDKNDT